MVTKLDFQAVVPYAWPCLLASYFICPQPRKFHFLNGKTSSAWKAPIKSHTVNICLDVLSTSVSVNTKLLLQNVEESRPFPLFQETVLVFVELGN